MNELQLLGTATVAARIAASMLGDIYNGTPVKYAGNSLETAESYLVQALDELRAVRAHIAADELRGFPERGDV